MLSCAVGRKEMYQHFSMEITKGFLSKKSFERLPRATLSGDEIGRFLCLGAKCLRKTRMKECSESMDFFRVICLD